MKLPVCLQTVPSASEISTDYVSGVPSDIDQVQEFLEYLVNSVAISASPGFTWGRSGNAPSDTYLLNDSVPSNTTGRIVPISSGVIAQVFVATETLDTWVLAIEKRSGVTFTEIGTISLSSQRTKVQSTSIAVTLGDELALKVKSGSCKNPVVGLIIKGSI